MKGEFLALSFFIVISVSWFFGYFIAYLHSKTKKQKIVKEEIKIERLRPDECYFILQSYRVKDHVMFNYSSNVMTKGTIFYLGRDYRGYVIFTENKEYIEAISKDYDFAIEFIEGFAERI